jgi:hypothetical protein
LSTQVNSPIYTPTSYQKEMHESRAKNKVLEWARRRGKSRSALFELLDTYQNALSIPVPGSVVPPFNAWIVPPTYPQASQAWTELLAFVPHAWRSRDPLQDSMTMYLNGNANRPWGQISVISAHNPDALQTAGLDFLWVTEAQEISDLAFQRLRPMLISPHRLGRAIWEGIPALYNAHWWWKMCDFAQITENSDYFYSHGTAYENPFLTPEQIEEIETDRILFPDAAWRRMYLAERSESAGFFRNIQPCTAGDLLPGPLPGSRYVAGLDLGRKHDATVLWIVDKQTRVAVYHDRWDMGDDWSVQLAGVVSACQSWGVEALIPDATGMGGDMFTQFLMEAGLPVEEYIFTESTRMEMLNALAVAMERETVHFPYEEHLNRELRAFQFVRHGTGKPRPDHPSGEHDDEIFALGMALTACDEGVRSSSFGTQMTRMRYLPNQSEAGSGVRRSRGAEMMAERRSQRMEERWLRAGIQV